MDVHNSAKAEADCCSPNPTDVIKHNEDTEENVNGSLRTELKNSNSPNVVDEFMNSQDMYSIQADEIEYISMQNEEFPLWTGTGLVGQMEGLGPECEENTKIKITLEGSCSKINANECFSSKMEEDLPEDGGNTDGTINENKVIKIEVKTEKSSGNGEVNKIEIFDMAERGMGTDVFNDSNHNLKSSEPNKVLMLKIENLSESNKDERTSDIESKENGIIKKLEEGTEKCLDNIVPGEDMEKIEVADSGLVKTESLNIGIFKNDLHIKNPNEQNELPTRMGEDLPEGGVHVEESPGNDVTMEDVKTIEIVNGALPKTQNGLDIKLFNNSMHNETTNEQNEITSEIESNENAKIRENEERTGETSGNGVIEEGYISVEMVENILETEEGLKSNDINRGDTSKVTEMGPNLTSSDEQKEASHQELKDDTSAKDMTVTDDRKSSWKVKRNRYRKTRSIVCYSNSSSSTDDSQDSDIQEVEVDEPVAVEKEVRSSTMPNKRPLQATSSEESEPDKDSLFSLSSFDSSSDSENENFETTPEKPTSSKANKNKNKDKNNFFDDLPPIEDLHISVKKEECSPVGVVYSIVNSIVVIESLVGTPALNLDSVLFKENGEAVGRIFDVFGPVSRPFYALRVSDETDLKANGIEHGATVYCAPQTEHTAYVFTYQLMKEKGSDASWKHDEEPPERFLDYSDDEKELLAKKNLKQEQLNKSKPAEPGAPTSKRFSVNRVFEKQPIEKQQNNSRFRGPIPLSRNAWQSDEDVGWHNRWHPGMGQQQQQVASPFPPPRMSPPFPAQAMSSPFPPPQVSSHMSPQGQGQHIQQQYHPSQLRPQLPSQLPPRHPPQLPSPPQFQRAWMPPPPMFCPARPPPVPPQHCAPKYSQQQPQRPMPIPSPPPHRFGHPPAFQVIPPDGFTRPPPNYY